MSSKFFYGSEFECNYCQINRRTITDLKLNINVLRRNIDWTEKEEGVSVWQVE